MPEHHCDEAAHVGDPTSVESATAQRAAIANCLEQLACGRYLDVAAVGALFRGLVGYVMENRRRR